MVCRALAGASRGSSTAFRAARLHSKPLLPRAPASVYPSTRRVAMASANPLAGDHMGRGVRRQSHATLCLPQLAIPFGHPHGKEARQPARTCMISAIQLNSRQALPAWHATILDELAAALMSGACIWRCYCRRRRLLARLLRPAPVGRSPVFRHSHRL